MRSRPFITGCAVAAAALAGFACTASEANSESNASTPLPPVEDVEPTDPVDLRRDLDAARTAWERDGADDYSYELSARCVRCLVDGVTTEVVVVDGALPPDSDATTSVFAANFPGIAGPVEELHDFIDAAVDVRFVVAADYDDRGRPVRIVLSSENVGTTSDVEIAPVTFVYTFANSDIGV